MPSVTDHSHLLAIVLPQIEISGVLGLPVMRFARVGVPSLRMDSSFAMTQSSIISPLGSSGWSGSQSMEWALKSPIASDDEPTGIISGWKTTSWPIVFGGGQ